LEFQQQVQSAEQDSRTATIRDIMDSMIDPSADALWESVASYIGENRVEENAPRNDEEWRRLRSKAITLLEGANLLLVPGRRVAKPGENSKNPETELPPAQIEMLIRQDSEAWMTLVYGLRDSVVPLLKAIERRDAQGLLSGGHAINMACESCHQKYWYPNRDTVLQQDELQRQQKRP
jgi:hypothetical protein